MKVIRYYAYFHRANATFYSNGSVKTIGPYAQFNRKMPHDACMKADYVVQLVNNQLTWLKSRSGHTGVVTTKQELELLDCIINSKLWC